MDIQKEREAFEKYCFEVFLMSPTDGHFDRELQDPDFYESVDTHRLWKLWQTKAQAVPEGFVLVPKEPTKAMLEAVKNAEFFYGDRALTVFYKLMIEAREPANDSH